MKRFVLLAALIVATCVTSGGALAAPAAALPTRCGTLTFTPQGDDNFYDIRTRHTTCTDARKVLGLYRYGTGRCVRGWRCTYGVKVSWTRERRVLFARGPHRIYFGVAE